MTEEHVFDAKGEFNVHEEAVDLSPYRFEDWLAFAIFWVLALVIFYQFFTRYALNDSASWTEEIARYLLIATAFVGAAVSVRKNNHIQVDFLYRLLPKYVTRPMSVFVDVARILFLGYCVGLTWLLMQKIGSQRMAIIDWPIGILYAFVAAGFVMMTWRSLDVAVANWRRGASVLEKPELSEDPDRTPPRPRIGLRANVLRGVAVGAGVGAVWVAMTYGPAYLQVPIPWLATSYAIGLFCIGAICVAHWVYRLPAPARVGESD
jgi:TRAP-type C4-dicarboxylate transport system permease small subunit